MKLNHCHAMLRKHIFFVLVIMAFHQKPLCQAITTVSGNYYVGFGYSGDGGPASNAQFNTAGGIVLDVSGNLYIADLSNHRIRRVDAATLNTSTYAGNGISGYTGDNGPATSAEIADPEVLAIDKMGNLYIGDHNNCIRKVDAITHIITTVAGNGTPGFSGDGGLAVSAQLSAPLGIAVDNANNIYIADYNNNRIRRIDAVSKIIDTYAGTGVGGYSGDNGPAVSAQLNGPEEIAVDVNGNLYISDYFNNRVRRIDLATHLITTVVGNGIAGTSGDGGNAALAQVSGPNGVFVDAGGNIYIADVSNRVRFVDITTNIISTIAGNGVAGNSGNGGPAIAASLSSPKSPVVDINGNIFFTDAFNDRIRKVDFSTGIISNYAGNYIPYAGDGGPSTSAVYNLPIDIKFDNAGNLWVLDMQNQRVRKIDAVSNQISTIAGNGVSGYSGDGGPADLASFSLPQEFAIDKTGNVFVADLQNERIRRIDAISHLITTVAGDGTNGSGGRGGLAINAQLSGPNGVAVDGNGNLYIANWISCTIDKVDASTKNITRIAGQSFNPGFSGDGNLAISARLYYPWSLDVDNSGNIYIADYFNLRVRKIDVVTGVISTVAGNGNSDGSGDGGLAVNASLVFPSKIRLDQANNLYISDGNRVRKVDLTSNIISGVAGTGVDGYSGDGGLAVMAEFSSPQGIAFNNSGEVYIADYGNNVIRKLVSIALPTKLLSFNCFLTNADETMITWKTALEEGTSYFDVEYSADGKKFSYLSTVKAQGHSSSYNYVHCCPSYGYTYYRLKMVDQDGKYSYSSVDAVKFDPSRPGLSVFPNPTSDMVTIRYPVSTRDEIINVVDVSGTTLSQMQMPAGSVEKQVSLKGLPKGIYLIQMLNSGLGPVKVILK